MKIGPYDFSPGLWPSLATLLLLPFMIGLGMWQLERATWKQGLVDAHAKSIHLAPVSLDWVLESEERIRYRPVAVRGRYDLKHQLLLDNRTYQGHAGYHVLTPLKLKNRDSVVLVNRGWVPVGQSRAVLPELPGPDKELALEGLTRPPPDKPSFRLAAVEEAHQGWPQVVQQLELAQLEQRLGYPLLPVIVLLDKADQHGFMRDWKPVYGVTPDKHRAYAMQWFTLALVLALIYIGVNSKRISNGSQREDNEAD